MRITVNSAFSASISRYISTGSVRRRRRPRLFQKRPIQTQFGILLAQTLQLCAFIVIEHLGIIGCRTRLGRRDPPAEQSFSNADLRGDMRDRTASIDDQAHGLLAILRGVLLAVSRHGNILPAGPAVPRSDVHLQGSTPRWTYFIGVRFEVIERALDCSNGRVCWPEESEDRVGPTSQLVRVLLRPRRRSADRPIREDHAGR